MFKFFNRSYKKYKALEDEYNIYVEEALRRIKKLEVKVDNQIAYIEEKNKVLNLLEVM